MAEELLLDLVDRHNSPEPSAFDGNRLPNRSTAARRILYDPNPRDPFEFRSWAFAGRTAASIFLFFQVQLVSFRGALSDTLKSRSNETG